MISSFKFVLRRKPRKKHPGRKQTFDSLLTKRVSSDIIQNVRGRLQSLPRTTEYNTIQHSIVLTVVYWVSGGRPGNRQLKNHLRTVRSGIETRVYHTLCPSLFLRCVSFWKIPLASYGPWRSFSGSGLERTLCITDGKRTRLIILDPSVFVIPKNRNK